jgi:hypothetical protein
MCLNGVERKTEGAIRVPNMRFGVVIWEMTLGRYWGHSFGFPKGGKTLSVSSPADEITASFSRHNAVATPSARATDA